jgi:hypothetical protein
MSDRVDDEGKNGNDDRNDDDLKGNRRGWDHKIDLRGGYDKQLENTDKGIDSKTKMVYYFLEIIVLYLLFRVMILDIKTW